MEANKNTAQKAWELLAKQLFDEPASKEDKAIEAFSMDESERKKTSQLATKIDLHYQLKKYNTNQALSQVKNKIQHQQSNSRVLVLRILKIAAVIVFALIIGSAAYFVGKNQLSNKSMARVMVDDTGLSQIVLSDGTLVTLNRDTKINYPDQFGSDVREISIEGEAFFEVTPNPNKPFIIHAGEATIKVLGTSFTVNAYPENDRVEVIVATGKVQFSKLETNQTPHLVILDPGEKGTYVNTSKELKKSINTDPNFLAWKTRTLTFSETSLKEVIQQLNKVYRVQIDLSDTQLDNLLLNAHFENETLEFILEVISSTHGLKVDKQNGHYLLLKKEA